MPRRIADRKTMIWDAMLAIRGALGEVSHRDYGDIHGRIHVEATQMVNLFHFREGDGRRKKKR